MEIAIRILDKVVSLCKTAGQRVKIERIIAKSSQKGVFLFIIKDYNYGKLI